MIHAPKIEGEKWFNEKYLRKRSNSPVVLVDFWTYTCVNCIRTIPYLRGWWHKYKDENFLIIGVHTPEFEFEKKYDNVKKAIKEYEIEWPVVLDNDYSIWNSYANRYWPAKYLIDQKGYIVYTHFGEGDYEETERYIQKLLFEKEANNQIPSITKEIPQNVCVRPTPELYCGFGRGRLANKKGFYHKNNNFIAPEFLPDDSIALDGKFEVFYEYVEAKEKGSKLLLNFTATEVNLVMGVAKGKSTVEVTLDNHPLSSVITGKDVDNKSTVTIKEYRMYNLIKSDKPLSGVLNLTEQGGNFQAYAFTFSGCV